MVKQFLKNYAFIVILTSIILGGIQLFLNATMEKVNYEYVGKINKIMRNEANEDVIIWGASTAEGHLIPDSIQKHLGKTVFNYGLTGTNIDQSCGLLEHHFTINNKKQDIVITLDIHGALTKRIKAFQIYNWLHVMDNDKIFDSFYSIDTTLSLKVKYLPFYKLLLLGKHNVKYIKDKREKYDFPNDGFIPREGIIDTSLKKGNQFNFGESEFVLENLKRVLDIGLKNNKRIYIVLTPCFKDGLALGKNKNSIISKFKSLEKEGIKLINYVEHPMNQDFKNFKDNTHLNNKGALLLTQLIAKELASNK